MIAESQEALEREVKRIFKEANRFRTQHPGSAPNGMNVLYSPPMLRPKVMIVSSQGGTKDGNPAQTKWPNEFAYLDKRFTWGKMLVEDFERADLKDVLKCCAVATNISFPQATSFVAGRKLPSANEWLKKSTGWVMELIRLMCPISILTYGNPPFLQLLNRRKNRIVQQTLWNDEIPLVACDDLRSRRLSRKNRDEAIDRIKQLITV